MKGDNFLIFIMTKRELDNFSSEVLVEERSKGKTYCLKKDFFKK